MSDLEVLQARRLPLLIILANQGEIVLWYPPSVLQNLLTDPERLLEWIRLLEEHVAQLTAQVPKQ